VGWPLDDQFPHDRLETERVREWDESTLHVAPVGTSLKRTRPARLRPRSGRSASPCRRQPVARWHRQARVSRGCRTRRH
jgi:hypothetical protein